MQHNADIQENKLLEEYGPIIFGKLLLDHTTHENIYWATDSYSERGEAYSFFAPITIESITGDNGTTIRPRSIKLAEEQEQRTRDKAEVFTPSWVCNAQNNLIDEAWFGRPNVFNKECFDEENNRHYWESTVEDRIVFSTVKGKTWLDYVKDMRLEITCGEAPYLVSRYDTTTGKEIPVKERIGMLDRKLRVISENVDDPKRWIYYAKFAYESTYGYEWQGDNLFLARENLFYSLIEHFEDKFRTSINKQCLSYFAYVISWNIWQMDGLKFGLPGQNPEALSVEIETAKRKLIELQNPDEIFPNEEAIAELQQKIVKLSKQQKYCLVKDWKLHHNLSTNKSRSTHYAEDLANEVYKIPFIDLIKK